MNRNTATLSGRTGGRQAIVTKYIGPTNFKGSRVKATAEAGSVTLHWDDALNSFENHAAAALALANRYDWGGTWAAGGTATGFVFVQTSEAQS